MKSFTALILLLPFAFLLLIGACNSDDDNDDSGNNSEVTASSLFGTVTNDTGAPIASGRVVAMERTTSLKFSTLTSDNGSYSLPLQEGVYDLAFDDANAKTTFFTGPVVIIEKSAIELNAQVYPGDAGADDVFGTIYHNSVSDLSGWTVQFVSNAIKTDEESLLATASPDAQGAFTATVGGERAMDIDIYDQDGNLVEFVDFVKLDGACRLEFTLGKSTPNAYRHDQEAGDHVHNVQTETVSASTVNTSVTNEMFNAYCTESYSSDGKWDYYSYKLKDGKLGVGGGHLKMGPDSWDDVECDDTCEDGFGESIYMHSGDTFDNSEYDIEVKDDGSYWYDYKIHVYAQGGDFNGSIEFEDETHDSYSLSIWDESWKWHTVNYNSDHPTLIEIRVPLLGPDSMF